MLFCGDVSPDVLEDGLLGSVMSSAFLRLLPYPAPDIAAVVDFFLRFLGVSSDSGASEGGGGCWDSSARGRLTLLVSLRLVGDWSVGAALRLRVEAVGFGVSLVGSFGGGMESLVEGGLSAASLAADERVTLCDIGK